MAEEKLSFQWNGIDKQKGKRVNGTLSAIDLKTAQAELKSKGIEIIQIKETRLFSFTKSRGKKIKSKDILLITRFLSTMLSAGLPILQILDVIARDQENETMKAMLAQIKSNVSSGRTLSDSFKEFPQYFGNMYCSLINTGEKSGTLDKILIRLGNYLEKTDSIRRKVKKAMLYPAVIIAVSFIVSFILLMFVVPQFQSIFSQFGAQLPIFTRVVVNMSNFLRSYWWVIVAVIAFSIFLFRHQLRNNERFAEWIDKLKLRLPVVGVLVQKGILARFTRTLAITMDSGMPILDSMRSMADIMDNRVYSKAIGKICTDLVNGQQLNIAMQNTKLFPSMTVQMIAIGEASGSLADMLNKVADYYEEDVNFLVDNLSSLMEPLIMVLLGLIIGSFVVAMYLPIFKLGSIVKV